jgi:hypothetical protein
MYLERELEETPVLKNNTKIEKRTMQRLMAQPVHLRTESQSGYSENCRVSDVICYVET